MLFSIYLKIFREEARYIEISNHIIVKLKRLEAN